MYTKLVLASIFFTCFVGFISAAEGDGSSSSGCGCCPTSRCASLPNSCSINPDCDCLQMTVSGAGMCANTLISCSALTRCESDNQTCSVPNTVCVNNTRCNIPVCYPLAQATPQMCPPLTSRNTTSPVVTTPPMITTTTSGINACLNGTRCMNNGTCQPSGNTFFCLCRGLFYGPTCQYAGTPPAIPTIEAIINGSNVTYERTVEAVLERNNWTNIVAAIDVTGSMAPCAASVYKWITLAFERVNKIKYYVFFNDGDNKADTSKVIGSTGGVYGIDNSNLETVLNTMRAAIRNGNGGDGPENDLEGILFGISQCPTCTSVIHVADNSVTPRDMILLSNVTKPVKVIVCQTYGAALNTNLMNIAATTGGSIHTLEQDIINLAGIPINGTIVIGTRTYRRTATGYVLG